MEQNGKTCDSVKEKARSGNTLNTVVNVVLIVVMILAAVCTYISFASASEHGVPALFGVRMLTVQTESMSDTLMPGDLIFDTPVKDPSTLQTGDIITYWTVIQGRRVLNTHRIVDIQDNGSYRLFVTKGDRNSAVDPMAVHESEIVGQYRFRIPLMGILIDYLRTSQGFLLFVVVPVLIFFAIQLVRFFRVLFEYQKIKIRMQLEEERAQAEQAHKERNETDQIEKDRSDL